MVMDVECVPLAEQCTIVLPSPRAVDHPTCDREGDAETGNKLSIKGVRRSQRSVSLKAKLAPCVGKCSLTYFGNVSTIIIPHVP